MARILIVDDHKFRQDRMTDALSRGHEVMVASDAHEAMTRLKQLEDINLNRVPVDLIISCVHINANRDLTVFDLLKWSRGNPQMAKVPFVLICTEPSSMALSLIDSVRLAGNALGASGYMIIEQFDAATFLEQIEYYLPVELRSLDRAESDLEQKVLEAGPDVGIDDGNNGVSEASAVEARKILIEESRNKAEA